MKHIHAILLAVIIAAATAALPQQDAQASSLAGAVGQAAMDVAANEALQDTLQDALSPNGKPDPARFKLSSNVIDDAKLLHPLIIKQLKSIAGSNEYWTGAQFLLYIAPSHDKLDMAKTVSADTKKPLVLLVILAKEKQAMLDVSPQLTTILPGNVQAAIVNRIILPNFAKNHMQRGIIDGTRAVLMGLQGSYTKPNPALVASPTPYNWTPLIVLGLVAAGAFNGPSRRYAPRRGYYDSRPSASGYNPRGGARGDW